MKVLITGIAGFIGSHCAERLLDDGHEVFGIDNFSNYYSLDLKVKNAEIVKIKGGKILKLDLRDENFSENLNKDFDYIFHFAAQPGISDRLLFDDYFSNNVIGTKNLIDFSLKCKKLKLFVNIGTSSIYGLEAIFPESMIPKPVSDYGATKYAAEQIVLQQSKKQLIKACSLRLFSVIGPRERPEKMYAKLIDFGLKGKVFPLFSDSEKHLRSFTYIGDIIDGIVSVIGNEDNVDGEVINLGAEIAYSTKEGIQIVEKVIKKPIKLEIKPKRKGDQLCTKANIAKAKKLLKYNPSTTLSESVEAHVKWYLENQN